MARFRSTRPDVAFSPPFLALCALWLFFGLEANAQEPARACTITVSVRDTDGSPSDIRAAVSLYDFGGGSPVDTITPRAGQAIFRNLPPSHYSVEVTATGYQTVTQPVDFPMGGLSEQISITLTPQSTTHASSTSSVPVLAPGAVKELGKVLEDLRNANNSDAK